MNTKTTNRVLTFILSGQGAFFVLLAGILLIYSQTFSFGFIWDDNNFILNNPSLQSWREIPRWFYDADSYQCTNTFWRPVRNFSFLADWYIAGGRQSTCVMHIHNVLMHLACALMLLWVLRRMVQVYIRPEMPMFGGTCFEDTKWLCATLFAALIWAVHPLNTETVAWIKCRDEQVFTLFYLWGMGIFLGGLKEKTSFSWKRGCVVIVLGALSVLTKEMALSYPLTLGGLWLMTRTRPNLFKLPPPSISFAGVGSAMVMVGYIIARHFVLGKTQQAERISGSFSTDMLTMVRAVARYVELSVIPVRQLADYNSFPLSVWPLTWHWYVAAGILVGATVLAILFGKRNKTLWFAWFGFLLSLLPVSNLVPTMQYLAERFLYLPLCFLVIVPMLIIAQFCDYLFKADPIRRKLFLTLAVALLAAFTGAANLRACIWGNPLLLFRTTWRDGYTSPRVLFNALNMLCYYNIYEEAIPVGELLMTYPNRDGYITRLDWARINEAMARCMISTQDADKALSHSLTALKLNPESQDARLSLAVAHAMKKETTAALELLDELLIRNPDDVKALCNKALILKNQGRIADAKHLWKKALTVDPECPQAIKNLKNEQ